MEKGELTPETIFLFRQPGRKMGRQEKLYEYKGNKRSLNEWSQLWNLKVVSCRNYFSNLNSGKWTMEEFDRHVNSVRSTIRERQLSDSSPAYEGWLISPPDPKLLKQDDKYNDEYPWGLISHKKYSPVEERSNNG